MPLERKASATGPGDLVGQLADPPQLPQKLVDRFPELNDYVIQYTAWWNQVSTLLQRDRDQLNARFSADEAEIDKLKNP